MIRHGYGGCGTCHVDPSGGELLTSYGRIQSELLLSTRYGKDSVSAAASQESTASFDSFDSFDSTPADSGVAPEPAAAPTIDDVDADASRSTGFLWGLLETPDWLLLGGAYRHMFIWEPEDDNDTAFFPMQIDLYGQLRFGKFRAAGSIGLAKVDAGSPHGRAAQITTNQGDEMNLISRTHWLGYDFTQELTLRAGRMNLPYGVRIPEHVMWVRDATRTDRESDQQHGVSLAYTGDAWRGELMGIAGNYQINPDKFRERGYSGYAEYFLTNRVGLGISSLLTHAEEDRVLLDGQSMLRQAHGVFTRLVPMSQLAVFVEANALLRSRGDAGYVAFAQADYELIQGLHFMLTGEVVDEGKRDSQPDATKGQGEPRLGGWATVDWFFLPHFEARVDAVKRQNDPFSVLAQLHVYL